jgi:hypothetical protein
VFAPPPAAGPEKHRIAKEEFLTLEKAGIIRRSNSPWASPLHLDPTQGLTADLWPPAAPPFISEYTNQLVYVPGTSNLVADALSRKAAAAAGTGWVCAAIADRSPPDLKDMALRQISAHRYRLSVPAQGCASSHRRSATSTSSATHPPEFSARWCPGTFGDRFSNTSWPGLRPAWSASGPRSTNNVQVPPQHIPVPIRRFSHIHVDLVGPLPASKGFTYQFTIIDRTSRWPEVIPIAAMTTVDCANALFQG